MEISEIRILKDFRNYFVELKNNGKAAELEINILKEYFIELNKPSNYYTDLNRYNDTINLLKLLNCVKNFYENQRDRLLGLYVQLFK